MGERVVVDPAAAARARLREAGPRPAVPLDYGHADAAFRGAWRATAAFREGVDHAAVALREGVERLVHRLGGARRVGFALGMSFVPAGFAYGLAGPRQAVEAAFCVALGGLLVGLTMPLKGLDRARRRDETK